MKLNDFAGPLLATAATIASTWKCGSSQHFLFAAAAATEEEGSCPGGTIDDGTGSCVNPYAYPDGESSDDENSSDDYYEDSSDDGDAPLRGNPNAHVDETQDPEDHRASCDRYLHLDGFKDFQESSCK